jgi:hypothetical protein
MWLNIICDFLWFMNFWKMFSKNLKSFVKKSFVFTNFWLIWKEFFETNESQGWFSLKSKKKSCKQFYLCFNNLLLNIIGFGQSLNLLYLHLHNTLLPKKSFVCTSFFSLFLLLKLSNISKEHEVYFFVLLLISIFVNFFF